MPSRGYFTILMLCVSSFEVLQWTASVILSTLPAAEVPSYSIVVDHKATTAPAVPLQPPPPPPPSSSSVASPSLPSSSSPSFSTLLLSSSPSSSDSARLPPLLREALQQCHAAKETFGMYPSVIEHLMELRSKYKDNYTSKAWTLVRDKLGGYSFASLLGIPRPHVFFCGQAQHLPSFQNWTQAFGTAFVMKPYQGSRRRGVKIVMNGHDKFAKKKKHNKHHKENETAQQQQEDDDEELSNRTRLIEQYGGPNSIIIVEALNESPDPEREGLIPPDYKFLTAGFQTNLGYYVDRNRGQSCASYFAPSSSTFHPSYRNNNGKENDEDDETVVWGPAGTAVPHGSKPCHRSNYGLGSKQRNRNMINTVERMAQYFHGNYVRIDMFDAKHGPILGEFEHSVGRGADRDLEGCLESYIFLNSAATTHPYSDDATFILQPLIDKKERLRLDDYVVQSVRQQKRRRTKAHLNKITDHIMSWFLPQNYDSTSGSGDSTIEDKLSSSSSSPFLSEINELADQFDNLDPIGRCQHVLKTQQNDWFQTQKVQENLFSDGLE